MKLFGNEPQERAMSTLIHDTNNVLSRIDAITSLMQMDMESGLLIGDELPKRIKSLQEVRERFKTIMDTYYKKFTVDFK